MLLPVLVKLDSNFNTQCHYSFSPSPSPTPSIGSCLTVADLKDALEEVYDARSKWYNIGLQLELPLGTLDAIESECKSSLDYGCRKMLQRWLETGEIRTWRALADALGSELVGRKDLKAKILKSKIL